MRRYVKREGLRWCLYALLLCIIAASKLSAQEQRNQFFEKDYAKGISVTGTLQPKVAGMPGRADNPRGGPRADQSEFSESVDVNSRLNVAGPLGQRSMFPPPVIILVVNSVDATHLNQAVQKAISLHLKGVAFIGQIYHIGDYRTLSADLDVKLRAKGIPYHASTTPPFALPITHSPAWVFFGQAGHRIVEGTLELERFITPLGQYRDPKWVDSSTGNGEAQKF